MTLLVLRALGLGDFVTGLPALRALRRAAPHTKMVVAMPQELQPLLELARIEATVHDAHDLWGTLPRTEFAVNLHGRGPQSHRLLMRSSEHLVAFANLEVDFDGPRWREEEHECDRWCRLLGESLGIAADPDDLTLDAPPRSLAPGAVVIHPGASAAARRWPADRFATVARWVTRVGHPVVITGSSAERPLAETVAISSGAAPIVMAGETDVVELAGLVAHARAVVCGDTGIGHLAASYGVPSVHLFGPTPPDHWAPRGPRELHHVLWYGGLGDAHGATVDPGLLAITTDDVIAALEHLLDANGPTRHGYDPGDRRAKAH